MKTSFYLFGCFIAFMACSENQSASPYTPPVGSGLLIDNGPSHGLGCTDESGNKFGLIYRTISITNDTTMAIRFQLDIPIAYTYPLSQASQQFNLYAWPNLTAPRVTQLDTTNLDLENFIGKKTGATQNIDEFLEPGEAFTMTIGTLFSSPPDVCSAVAYALFVKGEESFNDCNTQNSDLGQLDALHGLELMVGFCTRGNEYKQCITLPCGQISYFE